MPGCDAAPSLSGTSPRAARPHVPAAAAPPPPPYAVPRPGPRVGWPAAAALSPARAGRSDAVVLPTCYRSPRW
jgi:hypothetical protein